VSVIVAPFFHLRHRKDFDVRETAHNETLYLTYTKISILPNTQGMECGAILALNESFAVAQAQITPAP